MATSSPSSIRPAWLALAGDSLSELKELVPEAETRFVGPSDLSEALVAGRPRLVIAVQPPATSTEIDAIASERRRRPGLRVVLLTQPDNVEDRLVALEQGFDDALPSSIHTRELVARLRRLMLAPRASGGRSTIRIGDGIDLDLQAYELRRDGRPERLRPKEIQLLALLATHPRRAYSRRELIDRVWGHAFGGDPRTIDVHLRWLRSKIEADPEHPVRLVTVRGRGYRFDPPP